MFKTMPHRRIFILVMLAALPVQARDAEPIDVIERRALAVEPNAAPASHHFSLTLVYLAGTGWAYPAIHSALRQSAGILGQCGIAIKKPELLFIGAPERFRDFHTPVSRELAQALNLGKPTVYFVAGTRQRPAFDAEAIGRGNSRTRPELRDTVWVTQGTRDLGIVLAHELAHVLMDSGEHSQEPGNLMHEDTAPRNTRLSEAQCHRLREAGTANGLLMPIR